MLIKNLKHDRSLKVIWILAFPDAASTRPYNRSEREQPDEDTDGELNLAQLFNATTIYRALMHLPGINKAF